MAFLSDRDRQTLAEMFRDLKFPVHLELFINPDQEWSQHAQGILSEVVGLMPDLLHRLREKSLHYIRNLERDITMQVFVTPT
ncbi:hypothetical protein [Sulfobacillus thermotolerans]|uniref:hypothetical protein n=1 Tax=Sulfobacillus thermotolerans TaxID=338644 RepID=UPI003366ADA1